MWLKMALKDWKKTAGLRWYNKDTTKIVEVKELGKDGWVFASYGKIKTDISKTFKTKTQALKFANNYMGKN